MLTKFVLASDEQPINLGPDDIVDLFVSFGWQIEQNTIAEDYLQWVARKQGMCVAFSRVGFGKFNPCIWNFTFRNKRGDINNYDPKTFYILLDYLRE